MMNHVMHILHKYYIIYDQIHYFLSMMIECVKTFMKEIFSRPWPEFQLIYVNINSQNEIMLAIALMLATFI